LSFIASQVVQGIAFLLAGSVNDVPEHLLTMYPVCTGSALRALARF
jgi:hypothetical protein